MLAAHPFQFLSPRARKKVFAVLFALTVIVMAALQIVGAPLVIEDDAPWGIVSFEFAGDAASAEAMIEFWRERGALVYAGLSLGLDYLFLILYPATLSLGCALVAERLSGGLSRLSRAGFALAWLQLAAAPLDAMENYALIRLLLGAREEIWPATAYGCAGPKFAIISIGGAYLILAGLGSLAPAATATSAKSPADPSG